MIKLNLGCGKDIKQGWENFDMFPVNDSVKYIDLTKLPLPFPNSYADEILLSHILEHLVYRTEFMIEISRILKPGGKFLIQDEIYNKKHYGDIEQFISKLQKMGLKKITLEHISKELDFSMSYSGTTNPFILS